MKAVCKGCKYEKPRRDESCYCVKYGITIGYNKTHCVSKTNRGHEEIEQVRDKKNGG